MLSSQRASSRRGRTQHVCASSVQPESTEPRNVSPLSLWGRRGSPRSQAGLIPCRQALPSELTTVRPEQYRPLFSNVSVTSYHLNVLFFSNALIRPHLPKKATASWGPDLRLRQYHTTTFYSPPYPANAQEVSSCLHQHGEELYTPREDPHGHVQPLQLCAALPCYP